MSKATKTTTKPVDVALMRDAQAMIADAKISVPAPEARSQFAIAFTAWAEARTAIVRLDCHGATDQQNSDALDRERDAIWAVIRAPSAADTYERRQRAMFVQMLFMDAADRGRPTDNHTLIALAGMVTEILR